MLLEDVAQVDAHLLRIFIDEMEPFSLGLLTVLTLRTFHDERHKLVARTNGPQQFQSSLGILLNARQAFAGTRRAVGGLHGEAHIADDAEHVVVELFVDGPCLLVAACQHHFWSAAHTHCCRVRVQGLSGEVLTLDEQVVIEVREDGRIEADAVLDEEDELYARLLNVVLEVHAVLDELDDGEDEVGVAEPAEDVVEDGHVLVLHAAGDAVAEGGEHHAGHVGPEGLHLAGHLEGVVVGIAGHTDDQVDVGGVEHVAGFLGGADLGERGRIAHAQLGVLVEDFLVHASVVFEHEGVVGVGHNEHVEDAARHQVGKRHVLHVKGIELLGNILNLLHNQLQNYKKSPKPLLSFGEFFSGWSKITLSCR